MGEAPAVSGKARFSSQLGVLSLLLSYLTGIPAVFVGILALIDIHRHPGLLVGRRLAAAGIGLGLLTSSVGGTWLYHTWLRIQEAADRST
jgi:hypothetical protein